MPVIADTAAADRVPRVSVIVPVRNDPDRLQRCLAALLDDQADHARAGMPIEVLVVDDASTDHTPAVAEAAGVRLIRLERQSGPAAARNLAAQAAGGSVLLFIDADVIVHPDTIAVAAASFDDPGVDAVFGSYDLNPGQPNLLSQYKNLAHRFYHQAATGRATTFWSGCGAIRRDLFLASGGFDAERYRRPCIEDIDLGARLTRAGRLIRINKQMQATHLKRWTLAGIVRSDLLDRGIPWTRLLLRERDLPADLNLAPAQRLAAGLALLALIGWAAACWPRPWLGLAPVLVYGWIALADRLGLVKLAAVGLLALAAAGAVYGGLWILPAAVALAGMITLNHRYYRFFAACRGPLFAVAIVPMQVLYYLYSALALLIGSWQHWREAPRQAGASAMAPSS